MAEVNQNGMKDVDSRVFAATPGDEIVISGISGKYPSAKNVSELAYKLYNKVRDVKVIVKNSNLFLKKML